MARRPTAATLDMVGERDDWRCADCGHKIHGERGFGWSLHHRRPAGAGGDPRPETHAAANLVLLHGSGTTGCHGDLESFRAGAQVRGFLIPKEAPEPPEFWVIEHAVHGWVYLRDDGSIAYERPEAA
jgi:hypothetical protein